MRCATLTWYEGCPHGLASLGSVGLVTEVLVVSDEGFSALSYTLGKVGGIKFFLIVYLSLL